MKTSLLMLLLSVLVLTGIGISRSIRHHPPCPASTTAMTAFSRRVDLPRFAHPSQPDIVVFNPESAIRPAHTHKVSAPATRADATQQAATPPRIAFSAARDVPSSAAMVFDVEPGARLPMVLLGLSPTLPPAVRQAGEQVGVEFGNDLLKDQATTTQAKATKRLNPVSKADEWFHALYGDEAFNDAGVAAGLDALASRNGGSRST